MAENETEQFVDDSTGFFEELDKDAAKKLVEDSLPTEAEISALFMAGEHWQNGEGWVGPRPDLDDPDYGITLDLIAEAFTSRNIISEIVRRHTRGVIGASPMFGVVPRVPLDPGAKLEDGKAKEQRDIEAALTDWWDSRGAHVIIQKAVNDAQWAQRGILRLYVPRGKLAGDVIPAMPDLKSALSVIYLDAPDPESAAVVVHEDTKDEAGIVIDGDAVEMTYLAEDPDVGKAPNPNGVPRLTVIRRITDEDDEAIEVPLGGRPTMFSINRPLLITLQQQQMQRAANLALSMNPRNVVTGGFLERIILNALPPGHWETDTKGRKVRFVREPWTSGAGTTQWVRGIELPQKDGSISLTTPSVSNREPVSTESADNAFRSIYRAMLEEADQAHVLVTGETVPSGKSKQEGRADFELSLTETETPTNAAGRWLVETLLGMAEQFMNKVGSILTDWRGQFECITNAGPITVEERAQILKEYDAGLISLDTAQARIGVLDTQAEQARILAENGGINLGLIKKQATIIALLSGAMASVDAVAEMVGIDAATAKKLLGTQGDGGTNNPNPLDPNNPNPDPSLSQGDPAPADG